MFSYSVSLTIKKPSLIPRIFSTFRAFSSLNSSHFLGNNSSSQTAVTSTTTCTNSKFPGGLEDSIYAILTLDRWESLNHMEYRLASLRPVHGKLALKFLDWVLKRPGLELNHMLHMYCITIHIIVRARMYDYAKSLLKRVSCLDVDVSSIFGALMGTYRLCRSNPSVFDLLMRIYLKLGHVDDALETFHLMASRGFNPSVHTCNVILAAIQQHQVAWAFFKKCLREGFALMLVPLMCS